MKKLFTQKFIKIASKTLFTMAMLFAISPCAGKMYEPELPERFQR